MLELSQTLNLTHKIQCKAFPTGNPVIIFHKKNKLLFYSGKILNNS